MMPEPISKPTEVFLRSEEHTSELQSQSNLVCRLLLEKKKKHVCDLRIDASVHIAGHQPEHEDASALIRAASVVTAADRCGYGLVVGEAAAARTTRFV